MKLSFMLIYIPGVSIGIQLGFALALQSNTHFSAVHNSPASTTDG